MNKSCIIRTMQSVPVCSEFKKDKHVKYFLRCLDCLPSAYKSMDTSRMTILFFALSGLDLLKSLDKIDCERKKLIDWIYAMQILPDKNGIGDLKCGFRGSPFLGGTFNSKGSLTASNLYEGSHVAMTYTALLSLVILGDNLSRVNRDGVILGLKSLQLANGSFYSTPDGSENDMRFLYCACCISSILQDWRGIDKDKATDYIRHSFGYDCGISQGPQLESHGGSTFCGVASLILMRTLDECFTKKDIEKLKRWCVIRQKNGFQGRPNKPVDTCYSFWVGASLQLLDAFDMVNKEENHAFLLSTQHPIIGGFSKWPDVYSDTLHTYFGLCGLSLMNLYDLEKLSPALNISERAHRHLLELQKSCCVNKNYGLMDLKNDKATILTAADFHKKYKAEDKKRNIFYEPDEEKLNIPQKKKALRPITPLDDAIKEPIATWEELAKCFRERLRLQANLKDVSDDHQKQLVDILIIGIAAVWPKYRKQSDDPFLSDRGNKELQRRVAISIVEVAEKLFYSYTEKANDLNSKEIFSSDANISRLKTELLQDAHKSLNVFNIRRKLVKEMRLLTDDTWLKLTSNEMSLVSSSNSVPPHQSKSSEKDLTCEIQDMQSQMPNIDLPKVKPILTKPPDIFERHPPQKLGSTVSDASSNIMLISTTSMDKDLSVKKLTNKSVETGFHIESRNVLKRCFSMPDMLKHAEPLEEFRHVKEMIKRPSSVDPKWLSSHPSSAKTTNNYEDLLKLVQKYEPSSADFQNNELPPLLLASRISGIKKEKQYVGQRRSPVKDNSDDELEDLCQNESFIQQNIPVKQPRTLPIHVAGKGISKISDVKLSNPLEETKMTLSLHHAIYTDILNEIDDETVKSLDRRLCESEEINEVYDEITKTLNKTYLAFDKDDYIEPWCASFEDVSMSFASSLLQGRQQLKVQNKMLQTELSPPWNEYGSAKDWKNEPKFSGYGREDILKIGMERSDPKAYRLSSCVQDVDDNSNTLNKLIKSYSSWIAWYKSNLTTDDYRKFLSSKENDFLCQVFHLYDSEEEGYNEDEEKEKSALRLAKMQVREKRKQELCKQKLEFKEGFWNSQSVLLGGLGKTPLDGENSDEEELGGERANHIMFKERMEELWETLKMPHHERLTMAIKYTSLDAKDHLLEGFQLLESIAKLIVERESYMTKLEHFETSASDPNRFFLKGPFNSSMTRTCEAKIRRKLEKNVTRMNDEIRPLLLVMLKRFGEHVTYQGRNYDEKIRYDRVEMLYWLQQKRRKEALDIPSLEDAKAAPEVISIPNIRLSLD